MYVCMYVCVYVCTCVTSISPNHPTAPVITSCYQPFGDDHERQYIYKEPTVTTLGELTLRLQRLYSRKFGTSEIVHIIKESGKVGHD